MRFGFTIHKCLVCCLLCAVLLVAGCIEDLEQHEVATGKIDGVRPKSTPVAKDDGKFLDFNFDEYKHAATIAYDEERYQQSAAFLLEIIKRDINNEVAIFDLAVCYAQLDDAQLAADYLVRAVDAGYEELGGMDEHDAFIKIMDQPVFADKLAELMEDYEKTIEAKGRMLYVESTRLLQCRALEPKDYDEEQSYDLVLGLHGFGDTHNDFIQVWGELESATRDFIYAAPQAPYPFASADGEVAYSWSVFDSGDSSVFFRSYQLGEEYVLNVVERLRDDYQIDNVYLMGFSQGCTLAFLVGILNPDTFDGIIGFGGMLGADWLPEEDFIAGSDIPMFIAYGDRDRAVPPEYATATKDILDQYGYDVSIYEFHGGHELPADALERAARWVELVSQNKESESLPRNDD